MRLLLLLAGVALVGGGGWLTYTMLHEDAVEEIAVEPTPECDSCSARHKAYAKAKKSWTKKGKNAVDDAVLPELLPVD